uniref:Uncharacterized protein n=1 Tax=Oryza brachyantha TaxID=4533 RepID=J3MYY3_ORYBR
KRACVPADRRRHGARGAADSRAPLRRRRRQEERAGHIAVQLDRAAVRRAQRRPRGRRRGARLRHPGGRPRGGARYDAVVHILAGVLADACVVVDVTPGAVGFNTALRQTVT